MSLRRQNQNLGTYQLVYLVIEIAKAIPILYQNNFGTGGGIRTHTQLSAADFESAMSSIPSHPHIILVRRTGVEPASKML